MPSLPRQLVETSRGRLSVLFDRGGDPPLLLLHGVPGSGAVWNPVVERLMEEKGSAPTLVVPDLLGFGASDKPQAAQDLGVEAQAQAVLDLIDFLDLPAATVVTHDFGGPVALELYRRRPDAVSGLVLSATNAFPDTPIPFPLSTIFWPVVGPTAARLLFSPPSLRLLLRIGSGRGGHAPDPESYVGDPRQAQSVRTLFEDALRNLERIYSPLELVLGQLEVPTAVLWGTKDPFFALAHGRRTAAAIDGASFTVLEGAGHFLPAERPEAYVAAIGAFGTVPHSS